MWFKGGGSAEMEQRKEMLARSAERAAFSTLCNGYPTVPESTWSTGLHPESRGCRKLQEARATYDTRPLPDPSLPSATDGCPTRWTLQFARTLFPAGSLPSLRRFYANRVNSHPFHYLSIVFKTTYNGNLERSTYFLKILMKKIL